MNWMYTTQFDHARFDLLPLAIWPRAFWPCVTGNLRRAQRWSKSVWTFDRYGPLFLTFGYYQLRIKKSDLNSRTIGIVLYCYCCIVGIVVLLSKVSDYSNKLRLGLGRCHLEQRAYCLNVNWKIQVGTMGHFLIRLIDLQGSVTLNHRRQKHRFSQISRQWSMS